MPNLEAWPSLAALSPLALLLAWSVAGHPEGAAPLVLFALVALAIVGSTG
jgi:hypothetical protein